jgi:hypothetical protein
MTMIGRGVLRMGEIAGGSSPAPDEMEELATRSPEELERLALKNPERMDALLKHFAK